MELQLINKLSHRQLSNSVILIGLTVIFFLPYALLFNGSSSLCLHQNLFGFGCPGCGMTRATYLALHLNIKESLTYNFAIVGLLPFLFLEVIGWRNKPYQYIKFFFLFLLAAIYIYRLATNFNIL